MARADARNEGRVRIRECDRHARQELARQLKAKRIELGLSQPEAAERAGVTRFMWLSWENGKRSIPSECIARVFAALSLRAWIETAPIAKVA